MFSFVNNLSMMLYEMHQTIFRCLHCGMHKCFHFSGGGLVQNSMTYIFLAAFVLKYWYKLYLGIQLPLARELCVSTYALFVCPHLSHPRLNVLDNSTQNFSLCSLQWNKTFDFQHLICTRGGGWMVEMGTNGREEEVVERQRGPWKRETGALSVKRQSRK